MLLDGGCVVCRTAPGPVCGPCGDALHPAPDPLVDGLDRCRVALAFDDRSRPIVAAMKYRGERRIARWAADRLIPLVPLLADVITWIPATPERRRRRGFDQAAEIGRLLGLRSGIAPIPLLARDRADGRQTGRSRRDRQHGPQLCAIRPAPRFVVVVDDVVTTGSSMRVAAHTLREAGADRVVGLALAATPPPEIDPHRRPANTSIIPTWT